MNDKNIPNSEVAEEVAANNEEQAQQGVEIIADKFYAIQGSTILGILNGLSEELPIKYTEVAVKVENALSRVSPLEIKESENTEES
jgi:hypothetical protein